MLTYIFLLIFIPTILSYLILKFIYRIIFKSKEKISKFLVFLGSVALIVFYYTPYSYYLEPSYWQFRNMCKLNELPNDENKYNKILSYFDTDLESLDWEELNGRVERLETTNAAYKKGLLEYRTEVHWKTQGEIEMITRLFSNFSKINRYNVKAMYFVAIWHTKRFYPDGNEGSGFYWSEEELSCDNTIIGLTQ